MCTPWPGAPAPSCKARTRPRARHSPRSRLPRIGADAVFVLDLAPDEFVSFQLLHFLRQPDHVPRPSSGSRPATPGRGQRRVASQACGTALTAPVPWLGPRGGLHHLRRLNAVTDAALATLDRGSPARVAVALFGAAVPVSGSHPVNHPTIGGTAATAVAISGQGAAPEGWATPRHARRSPRVRRGRPSRTIPWPMPGLRAPPVDRQRAPAARQKRTSLPPGSPRCRCRRGARRGQAGRGREASRRRRRSARPSAR